MQLTRYDPVSLRISCELSVTGPANTVSYLIIIILLLMVDYIVNVEGGGGRSSGGTWTVCDPTILFEKHWSPTMPSP